LSWQTNIAQTCRETDRQTYRQAPVTFSIVTLTFSWWAWRDDVTGCHGYKASTDGFQVVADSNAAQQAAEFWPTSVRHDLIGWRPVVWVTWPADDHQVQNAWRVTQLLNIQQTDTGVSGSWENCRTTASQQICTGHSLLLASYLHHDGVRTPLHVPTETVRKKRQSTWFCGARHMTRFGRRWGLTFKYCNIVPPKTPLELPAVDQGHDSPQPEMRDSQQPIALKVHGDRNTRTASHWQLALCVIETICSVS